MNIEHMKEIREFISKLPDKACDMGTWFTIARNKEEGGGRVTYQLMEQNGFACGSAACIAGWTAMVANRATYHELAQPLYASMVWAQEETATYLGLNIAEQHELFLNFPGDIPEEGWKAWMVQRLDDCIAVGHIVSLNDDDDEDDDFE